MNIHRLFYPFYFKETHPMVDLYRHLLSDADDLFEEGKPWDESWEAKLRFLETSLEHLPLLFTQLGKSDRKELSEKILVGLAYFRIMKEGQRNSNFDPKHFEHPLAESQVEVATVLRKCHPLNPAKTLAYALLLVLGTLTVGSALFDAPWCANALGGIFPVLLLADCLR